MLGKGPTGRAVLEPSEAALQQMGRKAAARYKATKAQPTPTVRDHRGAKVKDHRTLQKGGVRALVATKPSPAKSSSTAPKEAPAPPTPEPDPGPPAPLQPSEPAPEPAPEPAQPDPQPTPAPSQPDPQPTQPDPQPMPSNQMSIAIPQSRQLRRAALQMQGQEVLRPGTDYACNTKTAPGACVAQSARAATEYQKLQQALLRHLTATSGAEEAQRLIEVNGSIDDKTRAAVKRLLPESSSRPYSNLPVTPWVFTEAINALPKGVSGGPSPAPQMPTERRIWPWVAGVGALALIGGGFLFLRR